MVPKYYPHPAAMQLTWNLQYRLIFSKLHWNLGFWGTSTWQTQRSSKHYLTVCKQNCFKNRSFPLLRYTSKGKDALLPAQLFSVKLFCTSFSSQSQCRIGNRKVASQSIVLWKSDNDRVNGHYVRKIREWHTFMGTFMIRPGQCYNQVDNQDSPLWHLFKSSVFLFRAYEVISLQITFLSSLDQQNTDLVWKFTHCCFPWYIWTRDLLQEIHELSWM